MTDASVSRNEIVCVADTGLLLQIDGREEVAPWSAMLTISVVLALVNRETGRHIPVFVLGISVGADERIFVVGPSEALWEPLASTLPEVLPGMQPFETWSWPLANMRTRTMLDEEQWTAVDTHFTHRRCNE